jgi:hypothetical protein
MTQTNTQSGPIARTASEALAANRLVGIINSSGSPVAALPEHQPTKSPSSPKRPPPSGDHANLIPLEPGQNVRVTLSGTCVPGDQLVAGHSQRHRGRHGDEAARHPRHLPPHRRRRRDRCERPGREDSPGGLPPHHRDPAPHPAGRQRLPLPQDADHDPRTGPLLSDTNSTTTVTAYTATGAGQLLSGKAGNTNAVWIATSSGTNSWVKIAQQ